MEEKLGAFTWVTRVSRVIWVTKVTYATRVTWVTRISMVTWVILDEEGYLGEKVDLGD